MYRKGRSQYQANKRLIPSRMQKTEIHGLNLSPVTNRKRKCQFRERKDGRPIRPAFHAMLRGLEIKEKSEEIAVASISSL